MFINFFFSDILLKNKMQLLVKMQLNLVFTAVLAMVISNLEAGGIDLGLTSTVTSLTEPIEAPLLRYSSQFLCWHLMWATFVGYCRMMCWFSGR